MKFFAFWKAGILTLLIFLSGIMFGIWIDNYRLSEIRKSLSLIDINWNDAILLSFFFDMKGNETCQIAFNSNLIYNSKIYQQGKKIEDAIKANRFTPELELEWKKYILLQTRFWLNSIKLKENCNFNYFNVVHFFKMKNLTREEAIDNKLQSSIMLDLKEKCGNKIMLIPITVDLNLTVVDTILEVYNISKFPAILIDEKYKFEGLTKLEEINKITNC